MAILVTLAASKEVVWKDTSGVIWKGTTAIQWKDGEGDSTLFLSLDGDALEHYYDAFIASFSAPCFEIANDHGGFVNLSFGQIIFSPDTFSGNWPPPRTMTVDIRYTATTEAASVLIFSGDIYLDRYDEESIIYDIYAPKYSQQLLDQGADYNGDTVPYPKAFGTVTHVEPLRVADNGGQPTYHLGGISTTSYAFTIQSFTSASAGTKTTITVDRAHGLSNGTSVVISGSVNFSGTHTIESVSGATFVIPTTYPTDNSETLPIRASVIVSGYFAVYDDGVPIQENVTVNGDGTFSLSATPVGTVTISGTASQTTLAGAGAWVQARLGVGSLDTTYGRVSSPGISYWATSQRPAIDFFSDMCAFFTHYFYIANDILHLGDMLLDAGSETLTEYDYFTVGYSASQAINQITAEWSTYQAVEERVDEVRSAKYVKEIKNVITESLYTLSSGTADGTETRQLIDSGATFSSDGVLPGHIAKNTTDNTSSVVVAVSETTLELEGDIFVSGETYVVGPSFPYGEDINITPYHDTKSNVSTALQNILSVLSKDVVEVSIPISTSLPAPGKKLTLTDTKMVVDTNAWFRARRLSYNFEENEVTISGEGIIS